MVRFIPRRDCQLPLFYIEEFDSIDEAYYREKQVQGWSRKKREALINNKFDELSELSMAYKDLKEDI